MQSTIDALHIEFEKERVQDPEADTEESFFDIRPLRKHAEALGNMPDNVKRQEPRDEEKIITRMALK